MDRLPELTQLLKTAMSSRADNITELAELTGHTHQDTETDVAHLETLGFLSITNGTITYRRPDVTVADLSRNILTGLARDLDDTVARTEGVLGTLPGLLQAWAQGNSDEQSLAIDVLHGPWAPADMWRLQLSRIVPSVSDVCMPDTSALFTVQPEYQASFWAQRAGQKIDVRLIMSITDATNPASRERVRGELDAGVQIRMHPKAPSFFWITDHDTVGIPLEWGQSWPTSIMAIQSPALAAILTWIYDRVWDEAVPVNGQEHPWESMLELMSAGMTMDSASHALGLTARTGRRRVADAMDHYGASSQFSLAAAWAGRRR
ncbi:hypothetical protein C8K36_108166 [Rhodococcus sp. OK519]|uniref:hypothetical protein n=1 Tax=Rhodococcus sp. OK519 TaxID=2135729 RepID=UPI000D3D5A52|nr:hypothetical protein C8K36_108166 [Rhodococcus sp. OK519]